MRTCLVWRSVTVFLITCALPAFAANLRVVKLGLGTGTVTSVPAGINCGTDCEQLFPGGMVELTTSNGTDSMFDHWEGACTGSGTCMVDTSAAHTVRAVFRLTFTIPALTTFTPEAIQMYLDMNSRVNTPARFMAALPDHFRQNWILMTRSESLQTGTAATPRVLLPSANAEQVFTIGLVPHAAYPGSHPNAIEYMQWDPAEKNFRFHEIVLDTIGPMGTVPMRTRQVFTDEARCTRCHSTRNVLNNTPGLPGTTGSPAGVVKAKNKPNWDVYDSWGGMLAFNRDRIYQGSAEATAFRRIFNLWNWRADEGSRQVIEQLRLQHPGAAGSHRIDRILDGGPNDGHVWFGFDGPPGTVVTTEPAPVGDSTESIAYAFGIAGTHPDYTVQRQGQFATMYHSTGVNDEGRAVQLFDLLAGLDGSLNQQRITDELIDHTYATGSVPIDVRPIALAITRECVTRSGSTVMSTVSPALATNLAFFTARNGGMTIDMVVNDTRSRQQSLPKRKADIQRLNLDRMTDPYLVTPGNGLFQENGTSLPTGVSKVDRLRQEVFRRSHDNPQPDAVIGGDYVDREDYTDNTEKMGLYRYFLEPLGVSVDKWSTGVRGRSRTYTLADVFDFAPFIDDYVVVFQRDLEASLGLPAGAPCTSIMPLVNSSLDPVRLPAPDDVPKYTDVQRIFNKACIECHGGLEYPPYLNHPFSVPRLDLSEDDTPGTTSRFERPWDRVRQPQFTTADPMTSPLYSRLIATAEDCPYGLMPCGGPALSKVDVETIRRWISGGRPATVGDPHIETIDGTRYDFQSAGEFVLLRGEGLEVQVRQTAIPTEAPLGPNQHTGLSSCVSLNSAVAIRAGSHRITYQPNLSGEPDPSGMQLRVDGKLVRLGDGINIAQDGRIVPTTAPGGIQIQMLGGTDIIVTPRWWAHQQVWHIDVDMRHARATDGIAGTVPRGNWLPALPDGTFLGPRPPSLRQRYQDLYVRFADAWRVNSKTSLFDYAPGTSTQTFTVGGWPGFEPQTCRLPPSRGGLQAPPIQPLPLATARQHCRGVIDAHRRLNCEQDVMVTGEPGFAETYLLGQAILKNDIPAAPVLISPDDLKVDLASTIGFTWRKTSDDEKDGLVYMQCVWAFGEDFSFDKCKPLPRHLTILDGFNLPLLWLILLVLLLVLIFLFVKVRRARVLLALLILLILIAALFVLLYGGKPTLSRTVSGLEPGKSYYWKVIAQDGKGGMVESITRRFHVK